MFDINGAEEKLGYVFKDKMLLRKCFTHSSYANEHNQENNERLEFFGDAILEFVVTEYLFSHYSEDEGCLTDKRKEIVSNENLLRVAKNLGIKDFVLLGNGQGKSTNKNIKLYSSVYEAIVAGIYKDGGILAVKKFINNTLIADYKKNKAKKCDNKKLSSYKSLFQYFVQKNKLGSISYETLSKIGPDHLPEFRVGAMLNNQKIAEGKGHSKREAEALAAKNALSKIKKGKEK